HGHVALVVGLDLARLLLVVNDLDRRVRNALAAPEGPDHWAFAGLGEPDESGISGGLALGAIRCPRRGLGSRRVLEQERGASPGHDAVIADRVNRRRPGFGKGRLKAIVRRSGL